MLTIHPEIEATPSAKDLALSAAHEILAAAGVTALQAARGWWLLEGGDPGMQLTDDQHRAAAAWQGANDAAAAALDEPDCWPLEVPEHVVREQRQ